MPEGRTGSRIGPRTQEGGTGGSIGVGGPPRPPQPTFQVLALVAATAGVIAGLLGYDSVLLILCGLSAVFNLIALLQPRLQGGMGGSIGVGGPPPPPPPSTREEPEP